MTEITAFGRFAFADYGMVMLRLSALHVSVPVPGVYGTPEEMEDWEIKWNPIGVQDDKARMAHVVLTPKRKKARSDE